MDGVLEYFQDNIEDSIFNVLVFVRLKKNPGRQVSIQYKKSNYSISSSMDIINYDKFFRTHDIQKRVSPFGVPYQIIYHTFREILQDLVMLGEKQELVIGISYGDNIPKEVDCIEFEYDRTYNEDSTQLECPVCQSSWTIAYPIPLRCHHQICRDCLFGIIEHSGHKCPLCRTSFIIE